MSMAHSAPVPATKYDAPKYDVRHALKSASPWIERLARFGYAAKGVVYCLVGLLALLSALGRGGDTTGSRGALQSLLEQPFGQILVAILAVGLAGYSLWCFIQAIEDPEQDGSDAKGIAKRMYSFSKGVIYFSLVIAAIGMAIGARRSSGDESRLDEWTAKLMSLPYGPWIVGILGVSVIGYGVRQLYRAWKAKLDDQLNLFSLGAGSHAWALRVSRFGIGARGAIFVLIGIFLVLAAYHSAPSEARGVGESLAALRDRPYGPWLLGIVALGLISYGIYEFIRARYRRIDPA
jgi:hypothetical protein